MCYTCMFTVLDRIKGFDCEICDFNGLVYLFAIGFHFISVNTE